MKKIIIVDVHKAFANLLSRGLDEGNNQYTIQQIPSGKEAIKLLSITPDLIDIILLCLEEKKGRQSGLKYARYIQKHHTKVSILPYSMFTSGALLHQVQNMQLQGYVDKSAPISVFREAVDTISKSRRYFSFPHQKLVDEYRKMLTNQNKVQLSPEEWDLIHLLKRGLSIHAIAKELHRSSEWIGLQFDYLLSRFQVNTRWDLILATEKI